MNSYGNTAVDVARRKEYNDIAELITKYKSLPRGESSMIDCIHENLAWFSMQCMNAIEEPKSTPVYLDMYRTLGSVLRN